MIRIGHPVRGTGLHEMRGIVGPRQGDAELACALEGEAEILLMQTPAEARVERAFDHTLLVHFEDAAGREAARQRLANLRRIRAR